MCGRGAPVSTQPPQSLGWVAGVPRAHTCYLSWQVATKVEGNPIMQDEKKGKARLYYGPIFWNYGLLPQTWEDPNVKGDADVGGAFGDNDPMDVVEIGASSQDMGAIVPVKPLGVLSMIDDGEVAPCASAHPLHTPAHLYAHSDAWTAAQRTPDQPRRGPQRTRLLRGSARRSRAHGHRAMAAHIPHSRPLSSEGSACAAPRTPCAWLGSSIGR